MPGAEAGSPGGNAIVDYLRGRQLCSSSTPATRIECVREAAKTGDCRLRGQVTILSPAASRYERAAASTVPGPPICRSPNPSPAGACRPGGCGDAVELLHSGPRAASPGFAVHAGQNRREVILLCEAPGWHPAGDRAAAGQLAP